MPAAHLARSAAGLLFEGRWRRDAARAMGTPPKKL
jgi:hypothetical protein